MLVGKTLGLERVQSVVKFEVALIESANKLLDLLLCEARPMQSDVKGNPEVGVGINIHVLANFHGTLFLEFHNDFGHEHSDFLFAFGGLFLFGSSIHNTVIVGELCRRTSFGNLMKLALMFQPKCVHDGIVNHVLSLELPEEVEVT